MHWKERVTAPPWPSKRTCSLGTAGEAPSGSGFGAAHTGFGFEEKIRREEVSPPRHTAELSSAAAQQGEASASTPRSGIS